MTAINDMTVQMHKLAGKNINIRCEAKTFSNGNVTVDDLGKFAMIQAGNIYVNDGSKPTIGVISEVTHNGILITSSSEYIYVLATESFQENDLVYVGANGRASKTGTIKVGMALTSNITNTFNVNNQNYTETYIGVRFDSKNS